MWQLSHPFFTILHCFPWSCKLQLLRCWNSQSWAWKLCGKSRQIMEAWADLNRIQGHLVDRGGKLPCIYTGWWQRCYACYVWICLASAHLASPFLISVSDPEGNDFFANWNMWSFFRLGSNTGFTWHFCSSSSCFRPKIEIDAKCEFNMSTFTAGGGCQVRMVTSFCAKAPRCIKYCCIWLLEAIMPPNC